MRPNAKQEENNAVRLVACDLDDTLLDSAGRLRPRTVRAVRALARRGILFTLITGRMPAGVRPVLERLSVRLPYGTFQGGRVIDPANGRTLYARDLAREQLRPILQFCADHEVHVNLYGNDCVHVAHENRWSDLYRSFIAEAKMHAVGDLLAFDPAASPKAVLIDEHQRLRALKADLEAAVGDSVHVTFSKPNFLECTPHDATKGHALAFIADRLRIPRQQVAAVGDGYNDLSMLAFAGTAVAMGNAPDAVRAVADRVVADCDHDGATAYLEELLGR